MFANEILVCFLFPIHIGVHRVYHLFTTVIHNGDAPMPLCGAPFLCPIACLSGGSCTPCKSTLTMAHGASDEAFHQLTFELPGRDRVQL